MDNIILIFDYYVYSILYTLYKYYGENSLNFAYTNNTQFIKKKP